MTPFCQHERLCGECGESFWGGPRANFCSPSCRAKRWRREHASRRSVELAELCQEVLRRRDQGGASYSKLLPRVLRTAAAELRRSGWDPIELLISHPDEPATQGESAPGGIEGSAPERRRWLHPPDQELLLLEKLILERTDRGRSVTWHLQRKQQLLDLLEKRQAQGTPLDRPAKGL